MKDLETLLSDISLTQTQAKIYIAIIRLGFAPVSEIAKWSNVRREQVYRIMPQLEEQGLVIRGIDSPVQFRAIPVNDTLTLLLNKIRKDTDAQIAKLEARVTSFLKNFTIKPINSQVDNSTIKFVLISERHHILHQILTMIQEADTKLSIIFSKHKILQFFSLYEEDLVDAHKRGVSIHVITEPQKEHEYASSLKASLHAFPWLQLRFLHPPLVHFILADEKELMLATSTNLSIGDHPKLWITDKDIINEFLFYFKSLWRQAHNSR